MVFISFIALPMGRNAGVPDDLILQRIDYEIDLKLAGLPLWTILDKVNTLAPTKGWGIIELRQLKYDIAFYYGQTKVIGPEEEQYVEGMKEIALEEMENIMLDLSTRLQDKNRKWAPFEYEQTSKMLFDMKAKHLEMIHGKAKLSGKLQSSQNTFDIYDQAYEEIKNGQSEPLKEFIAHLTEAVKTMPDDPDLVVKEDIHDV